MNIVDTPGTNVILQRQQRLTEEFVPRADLLFFVISADRPLTESEVRLVLHVMWHSLLLYVLHFLCEAINFNPGGTDFLLSMLLVVYKRST